MLDQLLASWIARRKLKTSTIRKLHYELAIWRRHGGADSVDVAEWQRCALSAGLQPRTINSVVATIALLMKSAGSRLEYDSLPERPAAKYTPTLAELNRVLSAAERAVNRSANWWRRWITTAFCTGLRRADLLLLDGRQIVDGEVLVVAEKTGKTQAIPLPPTLLPHLPPESRFLRVGVKQLLRTLREMCARAGVPVITPQAIRRLSAREWERSHAGAGAVILGHDIGGWSRATPSYIDRADLLRDGLPRLRLPDWIAGEATAAQEQRLTAEFRRLSEPQRESVVQIVAAMVR